MNEFSTTPSSQRIRISFFGLRNAGKSTLINEFTSQTIAIVNDRPGTTTDPVSKAMEILPLGPCLLTDTPGLDDDDGALGQQRVARSLAVLKETDIAIWVKSENDESYREKFDNSCKSYNVYTLTYTRGESVNALKEKIANLKINETSKPLISDLISKNDIVLCVCPIDASAPKGRLILPQQQIIREILDTNATAIVCQDNDILPTLNSLKHEPRFVITDSQVFDNVAKALPKNIPLTSFSIVFARAKGDLPLFCQGANAITKLKDGERVLIAEGCTHHKQCNDIGSVKIPSWLKQFTNAKLSFDFVNGCEFPNDLSKYSLVIHCGGCMLTRRVVQNRLNQCRKANVPIVNYGIAIATCHGISISGETCMVKKS